MVSGILHKEKIHQALKQNDKNQVKICLQLANEILQVRRRGLAGHDVEHLLADLLDLRVLGICSLAEGVRALLGESDSEHAETEAIEGRHVNAGLDQGLPLADERTQLVSGEIHAVEVGQSRPALDVLDLQDDLAERLVLILLEISQRNVYETSLQSIGGDLCKDY